MIIPEFNFEQVKKLPHTPFLMKGCEGECCGIIKSNKIKKTISLYKYADLSAPKVIELKAGDEFIQAKTDFYLKIKKYGSAIYENKKISVIYYAGEGTEVASDGKNAIYPRECISCKDSNQAETKNLLNKYNYTAPEIETWIKVAYQKGKFAWTNEQNFEMGWCE